MKQNAQLMAMIYVDSVEQARSFYVEKLGFTHMMGMLGKDGLLDFCTVSLVRCRLTGFCRVLRVACTHGSKSGDIRK